jgi:hypothetical protein
MILKSIPIKGQFHSYIKIFCVFNLKNIVTFSKYSLISQLLFNSSNSRIFYFNIIFSYNILNIFKLKDKF